MTDTRDMGKEIVSSTGRMGIDTRSDNRFYWNVRQPMHDASRVEKGFDRLAQVKNIKPSRENQFDFLDSSKRRDVMRFIATGEVAEQLINPSNPFSGNVEVAFPISDGDWYISLGRNGEDRKTALSMDELIQETAVPDRQNYPAAAVEKVLKEGYSFRTDLSSPQVREQVLGLWDNTFGWTTEEICNLEKSLKEQEKTGEKNVWFSALQKPILKDKVVVAVGMAEKIKFTRSNGRPIDIIELTEWSVDEGSRGNGYMPATVTQLAAQVLDSYPIEERKRDILLIAECNIGAYAHKTGYKAGLTVPERVVPQILKQNVDVNGISSDFAFMYISPSSLAKNYPPEVVKQILRDTEVK
ncbi:MAG TPA: hypothetical protein PKA38_01870 [Candidatus Levybacteria bacterium]|nr:hypothetical protein [Candidatus Levybacteria bacterium]